MRLTDLLQIELRGIVNVFADRLGDSLFFGEVGLPFYNVKKQLDEGENFNGTHELEWF